MQIHSFLAKAPGTDVSEAAVPPDGQPFRAARDFARHLFGAVDTNEPDISAGIEEGAVEGEVGVVLPFSVPVITLAEGGTEGAQMPAEVPDVVLEDDSKVGSIAANPIESRDLVEHGAPLVLSEPRLESDQVRAGQLPPDHSRIGQTREEPRQTRAEGARIERPEAAFARIATDAAPVNARPTLPPEALAAAQVQPAKEAPATVSSGPAAAQPMPPEQAKALGLARAPGIAGDEALPNTAVAKGVREAPQDMADAGSKPDKTDPLLPARAKDTPPPPDAEALHGNEGRKKSSKDRKVEASSAQTSQPDKDRPAQPALVMPQVQDAPLEEGAAIRQAEGQISGTSGASAQSAAPAFASTPGAGLGYAAIQQLAVAIRRSEGGEIEIALEPEELGKVRLTLTPHDTRVAVSVMVERPKTLDLIRRHIDALTNDLRQQGYSQVAFDFAQGQNRQGHKSQADVPAHVASAETAPLPDAGTITPRRPVRAGGLDLRL
jgi:flagellar hook-length control protein FliK